MSNSTWATIEDLYERFGDELMDKLGVRRNYDSDLGTYVADESPASIRKVIQLALDDAREFIIKKLQCKFAGVSRLGTHYFPAIKQWHIKLTIETLKIGGDCAACACVADLDKYIECDRICDENDICLTSTKTFISSSKPKWNCDCHGGCKCKC